MKATILSGLVALFLSFGAAAQQEATDKIGKMSVDEFNKINAKGNELVSAITPTQATLSASDKELMMKVAAGGMRQLAISQAVVDKANSAKVKMLAASEVEEQTNVSAKLKEMAAAKGVTLPDAPDAATQALVTQVQGLSGTDVDAFYIREGGIKGHELLQKTMQMVNAKAQDADLKKLATATLPVIRTHLSVSKDERTMMQKKSGGMAK